MKADPLYQPHMSDSSKQGLDTQDIWSISETEFSKLFESIYYEYIDNLFRFALFRLTDREKSIDVVQDILTKYYVYLKKLRSDESLKDTQTLNHRAYLFRSLRNAIIDQYRLKKNFSLDHLVEEGYDIQSEEDITSITSTELSFKHVLGHINMLKPELQELLYMRYLEGLSVSDIALALQERENSISVKLHRVVDTLKKSIAKQTNNHS